MNAETGHHTRPKCFGGLMLGVSSHGEARANTASRTHQRRQRTCIRSRAYTSRRTTEEAIMSTNYGRLPRPVLLAGGITAAVALPAIPGTPLLPSQRNASS